VLSQTSCEELPPAARIRLGIAPGQWNLLVRVILRPLERTLTDDEANLLRDRIYRALHRGSAQEWTTS
jgi:phenylalanyl-tRNA synthetase alpha chain